MGDTQNEIPMMFGERYVDGKPTGECEFFRISDIYKIVSCRVKSNWNSRVPLFYTKTGEFIPPLTLDLCQDPLEPFGILFLDSTNLVNINNVMKIDNLNNAVFENGVKATISTRNLKLVVDLIKLRDEEL